MRTSIIIAAHNEGESLSKTVQSCVETCAGLDYEIVIADDASVDDSVEEAQRQFPQLRVVRHEERRGTATTKDLGAREAGGDVFVFLDGHCNPEHGAIARLVRDIEDVKGNAIVTPAVVGLDTQRWRNSPSQVGHGYFLDLEKFHCGWLPLSELRVVDADRKRFYESPALIGCALAVSRELYEKLWGFDRHMRMWGVEDLDFGLKSWLMGHPILHDPEAVVGHRFRASFDNYDVPVEHTVVNQLRMARKNFTLGVWSEWVDRCRLRHPGRLADRPEGLWARVWELFEERRASVEQERAYLHARRQRDEFWYAERFGLTWPRLHSAPFAPTTSAAIPAEAAAAPAPAEVAVPAEVTAPAKAMALAASPSPSPSPCPPPCPAVTATPAVTDPQQGLTVPFGPATVSPLGGDLIRKLGIDPNQHVACDCGCGCGDDSCRVGGTPISLTYHSGTVNARPIIQVTLDSGSCNVVPSQIQAQLTFNGVAQGWVTFGTSGHSLADVYALPLQVASPVASSGIYPWSVEIKSTFGGTDYDRVASDDLPVVVNTSSPFGAGWSLGGIPSLLIGPRGLAMIDNSTGSHRYFRGTGPSYTSPPNDQGTLVKNSDSTFTYTAKDQTKTNFDSTGRITSQVDAHGLAQTLAYNGNLLSTITQPDGGAATFNYNGNLLGSIQLPGGRSLTPSYDGNNNLTGFTDAAGGVSTFGYDTSNRLVSEQVGPLNTTYTYSPSNGTLNQINRGQGTTLGVTAAAVQGLGASTAINASKAVAVLTDGLNNTTSYTLDALARPLQLLTADKAVQSWTRNAAGDPTVYIDQLNRKTLYGYNATADLTQITYPDSTTTNYQYELTFHQVTQIQDALGNLTKFTYDPTTGDLLTQTDALNNVTTYTWANGLKQTRKDALGQVTTLQWDNAKRRQLAMIDALNNQTNYSYDAAGNQTVVQDALGHSTTSTYDGNRRLLTRTNALGGVASNTYDAAGNTLTSVDELGRTTNYVYDQRGLPVSMTEAVGTPQQRTTTTAYDAAGNVLSVTDALGDITRYGYDALNRLVTVIEAYGTNVQRTTTTVYDLVGNVVSTVDALGVTMNHVFDVMDRPIQRIDAVGTPLQQTTTTTYDAVGNVLTVTNPRGTVTGYVYDLLNRPTQRIDAVGTSLQRTTTTAYDAVGNVLTVTNAVGAVTKYVYDAVNRPTQVIEAYNSPVQRTTTTAYDAVGNVLSVTNPRGTVTNYGYDALNRRTQQVDAFGTSLQRTLTTTYDAVGNVLSTTNGLGVVTNYSYDALNRRITQTDAYGTPLQRTTTTIYDAVDNVIATIDPLGYKTNYGYDALNRRISVQNPDGGTTTTGYDANDNVVSVTDSLGHTTSYVFDVLNRKIQSTDARGGVVKLSYDANDNLLSLTDPVLNITQWVYDALDRKVQEIDPLSNSSTFAYDAVDRLTSTTDRNGQKIVYSYDLLNRETGEIWYNASGTQVDALTFTYDPNDNLLTATNNATTTTKTYDALDRVASVQLPFGVSLMYTYDTADNRTLVQDSFGATTARIFDVLNRVTSLQLGGAGQTPLRQDFTYTARDQVATQTRYSDLAGTHKIGSSLFTYDNVGRLTNLQHLDANGANIAFYVNAYDLASRITSETLNGGTPINYTYDPTNQLTNDSLTPYTYDLNGNRTMAGYATGPANELVSDGVWNYFFDKNGNLIGKTNISTGETWAYGYDNRNRLISVQQTVAGVVQMRATYIYDALGQRIEKDVWKQSGGSTIITRFAYDGGEIWADLDSTNSLQTRYVRGERVLELLARIASGGTVAWILADRMGSVRNVVDNTGTIIDTIAYDGYGNIVSETNPANGGQYKYDGYRYDSETGWLRPDPTVARYYDMRLGRWVGQDPIGFNARDVNIYRYVHNMPVRLVDYFGLKLHIISAGVDHYWNPTKTRDEVFSDLRACWESNLASVDRSRLPCEA